MSETSDDVSDLVAWKEVHASLVDAVNVARAAVDAQKAQRRFWLEEICSNLNDQGKLTATSVWKRPDITSRKGPAIKKVAELKPSVPKRKKKEAGTEEKVLKKPRKNKAAVAATAMAATAMTATAAAIEGDPIESGSSAPLPPKKKPKIKISKKTSDERQISQHNHEDTAEQISQSLRAPPPPPLPQQQQQQQVPPDYLHGGLASVAYTGADFGQGSSQWTQGAQNTLHMMAAVAFGANPPVYQHPPPNMMQVHQQQYNPYYVQPNAAVGLPPHAHVYPSQPHGVRTYSSIHDVQSDEDSDTDKF